MWRLSKLTQFRTGGFPPKYPSDLMVFFAAIDDVAAVIDYIINSATSSLVIAMYALTDSVAAEAILAKMDNPDVSVTLVLDSSQDLTGSYESELLAKMAYPSNDVVIGESEKGSIMHLKAIVADMETVICGSTNLSVSGEVDQDNDLVVIRNPTVAKDYAGRIMEIQAVMLTQPNHLT